MFSSSFDRHSINYQLPSEPHLSYQRPWKTTCIEGNFKVEVQLTNALIKGELTIISNWKFLCMLLVYLSWSFKLRGSTQVMAASFASQIMILKIQNLISDSPYGSSRHVSRCLPFREIFRSDRVEGWTEMVVTDTFTKACKSYLSMSVFTFSGRL